MDQFIACHGRAGHALMLDTRSLDARGCRCPPTSRDRLQHDDEARARHDGYNERRADCEAGVPRSRAGCRGSAPCAT